jgi:hypothetical protein
VTLNIYVMPLVLAPGPGGKTVRQPKYTSTIAGFTWSQFDYGTEPWCMVGVLDISAAADTSLQANADVFAVPTNLDQQVGQASANTFSSDLESINMPGTWIAKTNTYRDIVRFIGEVCQFMERVSDPAVLFTGGVTLNTTWSQLDVTRQAALINAAQSPGWNFSTASMTGSTTLRDILEAMQQQWATILAPPSLAGIQL